MTDESPDELASIVDEVSGPPTDAVPAAESKITTSPSKPPEDEEEVSSVPAGMEQFRYALTASPMLDLFSRAADREHGHKKRGSSFAAHKKVHPRAYWSCYWADWTFRLLGYSAFLTFVVIVGWKALS